LNSAQESEGDFFRSLNEQHFDYMKPKEDQDELERDNELNFVQAAQANKDGPFKYLSRDQIDAVHEKADQML